MKKLILIALLVCSIGLCDSAYNLYVGTNSTIILPMADVSSLTLSSWVSNTTYSAGAYVKNSLLTAYWTPNGGLSTNNPTHLLGAYTPVPGGITWVRINNTVRRQAIVTNGGDDAIWLVFGSTTAAVSNGVPLEAGERWIYEGQKSAVAISATVSNLIPIMEEDL